MRGRSHGPAPDAHPRLGQGWGRWSLGCSRFIWFLRSQGRGRAVPLGCQKTNRVCSCSWPVAGLAGSPAGGYGVFLESVGVCNVTADPLPHPGSFGAKSTRVCIGENPGVGLGDTSRRKPATVTSVPAGPRTPASRDIAPRGGGEAACAPLRRVGALAPVSRVTD